MLGGPGASISSTEKTEAEIAYIKREDTTNENLRMSAASEAGVYSDSTPWVLGFERKGGQ